MGVLLSWQEALAKIQSGDNFGYNDAIDYYTRVKQRMFEQLRLNQDLKDYSDAKIGDLLNEEFNAMYGELSTSGLMELSTGSLQAIQDFVEATFYGDNGAQLVDLQSQITQLKNDTEGIKRDNGMKIKELQSQMKTLLNAEDQISALVTQALGKYSPPDGSLASVTNFLSAFMLNTVRWRVETQGKLYINKNARTTLMGYYKEIIERKILADLFNRVGAGNVSVEMVAGANTINDLLLVFDGMSGTYTGSEMISLINENDEQKLISMGAQIKARDLEKVGTDFMKISHQAGLRDEFNAQMKASGFDTYSWSCGVAFLGQTQNIIQSLGANNVLFLSGPKKYFMDDFIRRFRKENMYLSFQMDENHEATSQVGLQRYIENRKNTKNNLLRRFR